MLSLFDILGLFSHLEFKKMQGINYSVEMVNGCCKYELELSKPNYAYKGIYAGTVINRQEHIQIHSERITDIINSIN